MIPGVVAANRALAVGGNAVAQSILDNLISWWEFEENDATVAFIDRVGTQNLRVGNAAGTTAGASLADGKIGRCLDGQKFAYDNTSGRNPAYGFGNESFTIFTWARRISTSGSSLAGRYSSTGSNVSYLLSWAGQHRFLISPDGTTTNAVEVLSAASYSTGTTWRCLAGGYDKDNGQIFVISESGAKATAAFTGGPYQASSAPFGLQGRYTSTFTVSDSTNADLDNMLVMAGAMTADQYALLYNSGAGLSYDALVALAAG